MKQTLHIFMKDVRALRWQVPAIVLGVAIVQYLWHWSLLGWIALLAQYYLVAVAVHQDAIPGDRQFWITRPIDWRSLLAAKMLFIVLLVTVPGLVTDWAVLSAEHLAPQSHVTGLLWKAGSTTIGMIGVAAVAAVTRNLGEFVGCHIILIYLSFTAIRLVTAVDPSPLWLSLEWAQTSLITAVTSCVMLFTLVWQYARRRTWGARVVVACTPALMMILYVINPARLVLPMVYRLTPRGTTPPIHLAFESAPVERGSGSTAPGSDATVYLPLLIEGLPEDTEMAFDASKVEIQSQDGRSWRSGWSPWVFQKERENGPLAAHGRTIVGVPIYGRAMSDVRFSPVSLRVWFAVTVFRNGSTNLAAQEGSRLVIPGYGVCTLDQARLDCRSALRVPSERLAIRAEPDTLCSIFRPGPGNDYKVASFIDERTKFSNSPYPAESQLFASPVAGTSTALGPHGNGQVCAHTKLQLVVQQQMDRIRLEVFVSNLILNDYAHLGSGP